MNYAFFHLKCNVHICKKIALYILNITLKIDTDIVLLRGGYMLY